MCIDMIAIDGNTRNANCKAVSQNIMSNIWLILFKINFEMNIVC